MVIFGWRPVDCRIELFAFIPAVVQIDAFTGYLALVAVGLAIPIPSTASVFYFQDLSPFNVVVLLSSLS
jgi:hypothetical protein